MKVTVTFEFDLPQENSNLQATLKGFDLLSGIRQLDADFRIKLKHSELSEDAHAAYEDVRRRLNDLLDEAGVQDVY